MRRWLFNTLLYGAMITILSVKNLTVYNIVAIVLISTLILNNILTKIKLRSLELEFGCSLGIEFRKRSNYDIWGLILLLFKSIMPIFKDKSIFSKDILNRLTNEEILAVLSIALVLILSLYELKRMSKVRTRVYWDGILFDDGEYYKWSNIKEIKYGEAYDNEGYLNLEIINGQGKKQKVDIKGEHLNKFNEMYESRKEILLFI